jgi:hypothetical protein
MSIVVRTHLMILHRDRLSSDGNDPPSLRYGAASGSRLDERRLGLVGNQLAQERNQRRNGIKHDEHDTDREAAEAKLGEEFCVPGVGRDRRGAGRFEDYSRKVSCKERRKSGIFTRFVALGDRDPNTPGPSV